jgi:hypothetical protein
LQRSSRSWSIECRIYRVERRFDPVLALGRRKRVQTRRVAQIVGGAAADPPARFLEALQERREARLRFLVRLREQEYCHMAQMANTIQEDPTPHHVIVRELVVPATEEALNRALAQAGVQADEILSIMWQPGSHMAIGDHWPKYRVIYRA